ncbi:fasciclin domain-containing protein [Alteromonas sp. BL110]|uniref:fasciclin domain-containing protein n=1 Tax=Alteromonas sp. BL110 TaxID=1714845 RepID=UPI000E4C9BE1|nr:fasciclin domain-containing protein [Alteromonas sp. BL110]AXT39069.1 fasciclin domain-containing protein [Alteromonas sp. BL110]RKM85275.1 fasciclin domain-containing protein [Alteromonas sp. BL110]
MKKLMSALFFVVLSTNVFAGHHAEGEQKDIVDTAASNDMFSTLVAAVKSADLVSTLKGEGPFTVFAPTDDAFAALPDGTIEMLLKPENKQTLTKILTYHVVAGKVTAKDVSALTNATTVEGSEVMVSTSMNKVMINDAQVIKADVMTSNGVIHVIDTVLLPNDVKASL